MQKKIALSLTSIQSRVAMLEKVQKLLENQSLTLISSKTNLPYCWLRRVKLGLVESPNLKRLESLHAYLITL